MKTMFEARRSAGMLQIGLAWHMLGGRAWHDGGAGEFSSFAGYYPQERLGVVVLSNAFALPGIADIGIHLMNPKVPLVNAEAPKPHTGMHLDPEILDRYTGPIIYRIAFCKSAAPTAASACRPSPPRASAGRSSNWLRKASRLSSLR
jgi:hypothetical protein